MATVARYNAAALERRRYLASAFSTVLLAIGVVLICWHEVLVPEKATNDAQLIQRIAQGKLVLSIDDKSYGNIGAIYRFLGLGDHPLVASILGFAVYFVLLATVVARLARYEVRWHDVLVLVAAAALGGIFLGQYSKDVLVALLALVAFLIGRRWTSEAFFVACALAYATYFRQYWYLVIVLYLLLRLAHRYSSWLPMLLAVCMTALVVVAFVLPLAAGVDIQSFRLAANESRVGSEDARTMIMPVVSGSSQAVGALNTLITFVQLLVPVPMFLMGAQHAAYALFLVTIWCLFLWGVHRGSQARNLPVVWYRTCALVLAMVSVQAIFEPDYGSYLRHLTPFLPLMVFVVVVSRATRDRGPIGLAEAVEERQQA